MNERWPPDQKPGQSDPLSQDADRQSSVCMCMGTGNPIKEGILEQPNAWKNPEKKGSRKKRQRWEAERENHLRPGPTAPDGRR